MKIYLDANAITKVGHNFSKTQYVKIAKLCTYHGYSVVMHEVAKREIETQIADRLLSDIESAILISGRIGRKANSPELRNKLIDQSKFFENHKEDLLADKLQPFHSWLEKCKADVLLISDTDAASVFDDYFAGNGAFASIKNRKDIPDAFILEGLRSLKDVSENVVVVCDDGNLGRAVGESGVTKHFKHFDDLLKSDIVKDVEFDFSLERLLAKYDDTASEIIVADQTFIAFVERSLEDYDWDHYALDEDSEGDPRIEGFGDFQNFETELLEASGNEIRIRCTYDVDVDIAYFIYKADAYCMPDDEISGTHLVDWNKHYFLASTSTTLSFEVECAVYIDEDFSFSADDKLEDVIAYMLEYSSCDVEYIWSSEWNDQDL